ncbi:flippase-like domain-containing protein [Candidatus Saccharibacteria bacterium]|nr:flippase-like domain-containing protein [Candidatus Saccharibacteria bacterium]MBR3233852.1 flippase-like domain-containing protein [Candidatus Saccharibacteria bacterium]
MGKKQSEKNLFKSMVRYVIVFIALIVLTFWLIFKDQDINGVFDALKGVNYWYILLGIAIMFGYLTVQAQNVRKILACFNEKISLLKSLKYTMIEFFFCALTPGASGGQPVEIYYMNKDGIPTPKATLAVLVQILDFQIAVMAIGIISQAVMWFTDPSLLTGTVSWLLRVGMIINGVALIILAFCIFSNRMTKMIVNWALKFLKKIGIKNIEEKRASIEKSLDSYQEGAKFIRTHRKEFLLSIGRALIQVSLYYLVPFCVYKAFGLHDMTIIQIFNIQSVLFLATSGLPLPGAIGASESVFLTLYGAAFGERLVSSAMLLNRGINFYLFVIITMIVVMVNAVNLKRKELSKKK